jgi:hypothetical protein
MWEWWRGIVPNYPPRIGALVGNQRLRGYDKRQKDEEDSEDMHNVLLSGEFWLKQTLLRGARRPGYLHKKLVC